MMMIQLDVDIVTQLKLLLPSYYDLIVPSPVISELKKLTKNSKGKDKLAAKIALKIAEQPPFKTVKISQNDHVDNILLNYCNKNDLLCTNDKILRKRAKKRGISVVYLRQHKFLEVDGYIRQENKNI